MSLVSERGNGTQIGHISEKESVLVNQGIENLRLLVDTRLQQDLLAQGFGSKEISEIISLLGHSRDNDTPNQEPAIYKARRILAERIGEDTVNNSPVFKEILQVDEQIRKMTAIKQDGKTREKKFNSWEQQTPLEEAIHILSDVSPEILKAVIEKAMSDSLSKKLGMVQEVPSLEMLFSGGQELKDFVRVAKALSKGVTLDQFLKLIGADSFLKKP